MGISGIVGQRCRFIAFVMHESTEALLLCQGWDSLTPWELLDCPDVSRPGLEGESDPAQQQHRTGRKLQSVPVSGGIDVTCLSWKSDPPAPSHILAIPIKIIIGFSPLHLTF